MQNIAREMNLSETAFVETTGTGSSSNAGFAENSVFNLRWFTIGDEVPLCGHATLATAAVLFQGVAAIKDPKHTCAVNTLVVAMVQCCRGGQPTSRSTL